MKIALLGKGGSGKSSVSWLLINRLLERGDSVLAIDADHNMDLMVNLNLDTDPDSTISNSDEDFRSSIGLDSMVSYKTLVSRETSQLPSFSFADAYVKKYTRKVRNDLLFMNGGLGFDNVLTGNKCAHAYLSPLKYLLPLMKLEDNQSVIIDSVAGVDMVNFGLFAGVDAVVVVINNHSHSVRVLEQIIRANKTIQTPVYFVINKYNSIKDNEFVSTIKSKYNKRLLGILPQDDGVFELDYDAVNDEVKAEVTSVLSKIPGTTDSETLWSRVTNLDTLKLRNN